MRKATAHKTALLLTLLLISSLGFAATKSGVTFPDAIKLKKKSLVLNGLGVREATIFKVDVYVAGIYLPQKTNNPNQIIQSKVPKILKMEFVREVTGEQMNEAWDQSLAKAAYNGKFTEELDKLKKAMPEKVKKGDKMTFAFAKDKTYLMLNNQRAAEFKGPLFAKALLTVWFGPNPPNESLRQGMLGIQ